MKYLLASIVLLVLALAACTKQEAPTGAVSLPSADEAMLDAANTDGCVMMKRAGKDLFDCFGCSNNACRQADPAIWQSLTSEDSTRLRCIASPRGCVVA